MHLSQCPWWKHTGSWSVIGAMPRLNDAFAMIGARVRVATWRRRRALAAVVLSALVLSSTLAIANWYMAQEARLGVLHFLTSCLQSQHNFTTATGLLHLFQFDDAEAPIRQSPRRIPIVRSPIGASR